MSDYWEDSSQVFVHYGQRFGLAANLRTVLIPSESNEASQSDNQPIVKTSEGTQHPTTELCPKRGPKFQDLPDETINQLALAGLSSRDIAEKLNSEGHRTSHKTIQRRLAR